MVKHYFGIKRMKCKRCGRTLKNPKSIKLGYGLVCAKKEGIITKKVRIKKVKKELNYKSLEEWE